MKQFFSNALGAFVGAFLAMIVCSILTFIFTIIGFIGFASAFSTNEKVSVDDNSLLKITLEGTISERSNEYANIVRMLNDKTADSYTLSELVSAINEAAKNDKIKGIYLECNGIQAGIASSYELRNALTEFKKSKKKIYSYSDSYSQNDYYLASVSDSIFINPKGMLDLHGLSSSYPYFKGLLDNLGIQMQVFKVGTFKSAVEPYILTEMSEANKLQINHYLGQIWGTITSGISKSRNMTIDQINMLADSITITQPVSYLQKNKLVDGICYSFDLDNKLKRLSGLSKDDDLNFISPSELNSTVEEKVSENKIALLYADGEINSESEEGIIADDMIEAIIDASKDDDIKGLVMRVNSPGGSAYDSEQIWAALELFKKTGKPFAVSMGNYAASGGYYISCGADRIFAEPTTITGSIGIFGMVPNLQAVTKKIGVTFNTVSTNSNGDFFSVMKPMNNYQAQSMQRMVNRGYELFTSRCATGRNMPIDTLKSIAEGRVWDGNSALKLGLVDELGSVKSASEWVAKKAGITNYEYSIMPEQTDALTKILNKYLKTKLNVFSINGFNIKDIQEDYVNKLLNRYPIQAKTEVVVEL
ncbi:MAG: signal peptide peptidase SppA [Muribaculaceae bacterium]|nr:signal peptide peptidase SppA [Muribaculaceae bacterium]